MQTNKLKNTLLLIFSCGSIIWIMESQWYRIKPKGKLAEKYRSELIQLGLEALNSREVPVSCVLLYGDSILGKGYNTAIRDTNLGGHAEINAISDAVKKIGFKAFQQLNRDSVTLITTFEPCLMCRGALVENHIRHVAFIREKEVLHWWRHLLNNIKFDLQKQQWEGNGMQDSLFHLHPDYPTK